jgi:hypothetical protein
MSDPSMSDERQAAPGAPIPPPRKRRRSSGRLIPPRFDWATGWISALTAILTLTLGVITAWGLFGTSGSEPSPLPPTPVSTSVKPALLFEGWEEVAGDLILFGSFENVNLTTEEILLLGQPPDDADAPFVPLRAEAEALSTFPVDLANGDWRAIRPVEYSGLGWRAVVWPRGLGAGDAFADLRKNGPEAGDVVAVSGIVDPVD